MSIQRSQEVHDQRGLRPPVKMLVEVKIDGSATEQFLQMAGAIAYSESTADQGVECSIDCTNPWVHDAIASIAGELCLESTTVRRLQFPSIYKDIPQQSVIFPLEKSRDVPRFSFAVNDFYGVRLKRDYLWTKDCYANMLCWHVNKLFMNRRTTDRGGGVFLAMNFANETPVAKASGEFWKQIIRWLDDINQPIITPRRFLCGDAKRCAILYSHLPSEDTIIQWAAIMAGCRLYIGPDCLLSQLAYSLRVPAIVISELKPSSYLDRHDAGKYADPLHQYCYLDGGEWKLENVTARHNELERILITEY